MSIIYYNNLNKALEAKKCHFCSKPMDPHIEGFNSEFIVENGYLIVDEEVFPLDRDSSFGFFQDHYPAKSFILSFKCKEHNYRSDITIECWKVSDLFLPKSTEEEILILDDNKIYYVRNLLDCEVTQIKVIDKNLINIITDIEELPYLEVELIKFPDTISALLKKVKIYLAFS